MRTEDRLDLALWPSTAVDYIFEKPRSGEPRGLTLAIEFDPSKYGPESPQRALEDAETYEAIGRQFLALDTRITLQSTMDPNQTHALDSAVFGAFADSVAAFLRELVKNSMPLPPVGLTIHVAVEPKNENDLFELDVTMTISTGEGQTTSKITPPVTAEFAGAFESAYADAECFLKVLSAPEREDAKSPWIMRLRRQGAPAGPGIAFDCNGPARYYAPVALSNIPLSRSGVPIVRFDPRGGIAWNDPDYSTFSGIDMDKWARLALSAIDYVLSVDVGDAQSENLRKLSLIKTQLAAQISSTLFPILSTNQASHKGSPLESAIKTLRQQMLAKAESAYEIIAICQFEATVSSRYVDDPANLVYAPRFAGTLCTNAPDTPGEQKTWQFTAARAVLAPGKAFVSSALRLAQPAARTNLPLDLFFDVQYVYYAAARSALSFVIPFQSAMGMAPETAIGAVDIPISLREIPPPPMLASQEATPAGNPAMGLAGAKRWTYAFTYEKNVVEQDTIDVSLLFNVPQETAEAHPPAVRAEQDLDLLDHLARIAEVWPAMRETLTRTSASQIDALLSDFVRLLEPLPLAWAAWRPVTVQRPQATRAGLSLRERNEDGFLALTRTLGTSAASLPEPVIQILDGMTTYTAQPGSRPGEFVYVDENGNGLTSEAALCLTRRRVVFAGLDIASFQNASSALEITRNLDLVRDAKGQIIPTNQQFVYSANPVHFAGSVSPRLSSDERFDVSLLSSPRQQALATHLERVFAMLYEGTKPETIQVVRLDAAYVQLLGDDVPGAVMPIFAGIETPLDRKRADELANECASLILNWFAVTRPADGGFRFTLAVFPTLSESRLPLLELTRLELSLGDITDLA